MNIFIKDDQLHFLAFSLAMFFTLVGWSVFHWQQEEHKAQAIRDYRRVVALEKRLERFEQVERMYRLIADSEVTK